MCKVAGVSRSGYYAWLNRDHAKESFEELLVLDLFELKNGKYGIRRLKMALERKTKLIFNLKRIIRIKKKFGLETKIRRPSRMRIAFKNAEEHKVYPNLLKRNFEPENDQILISTDITELVYSSGQKAYLSAFKDLKSKKIIHYQITPRPTIELAITGLDDILGAITTSERNRMIIHSDQGLHYTSHAYRQKLKTYGVTQSMSRKGNCLDNAPIESFFGHLKDESGYRNCKTLVELKREISRYIKYYNDERPQWGLKRKTPAEAGAELGLVF